MELIFSNSSLIVLVSLLECVSTGVGVSKTDLSKQSESEMSKTLNSSVMLFMSTKS